MQILKNIKISRAFLLVVLVPLLVALIFASKLVLQEFQHIQGLDRLSQLVSLSVKMSNLVHEQQKERGATAVFVGSKGTRFRSELAAQRNLTDQRTYGAGGGRNKHGFTSFGFADTQQAGICGHARHTHDTQIRL